MCEQLLAAGAEPDARDDADRSALHFAAMFPAADEGRPRARARASEGLRGANAARTKSRTKMRCAARQSRGAEGTRPRRCARSCAAMQHYHGALADLAESAIKAGHDLEPAFEVCLLPPSPRLSLSLSLSLAASRAGLR